MINKTRIKCQSKTDTIGQNAHTYVYLWMYLKQKAINIDGETRSRNSEGEKKWKWQPENFLMDILIFSYIVDFSFWVLVCTSLPLHSLDDKFDKPRKFVDVSIKRKIPSILMLL